MRARADGTDAAILTVSCAVRPKSPPHSVILTHVLCMSGHCWSIIRTCSRADVFYRTFFFDSSLILHWFFIDSSLIIHWFFIDSSLIIDWFFINSSLILHWFFIASSSILHWFFIDFSHILHWFSVDSSHLLHWISAGNISKTSGSQPTKYHISSRTI